MPSQVGLYIHTPWCIRKCPYCDFNSHVRSGELPERNYLNALLQDFSEQHQCYQPTQINSVFIGGGTPSLLSSQFYEQLFTAKKNKINFSPNIEITLEANPGTAEQQRFYDYYQSGINRLSIGIQSFQDDQLKQLGRIHSSAEAIQAVKIAKQAGFSNYNIDLMYGLPHQTINDALNDLQQAIALNPTHISWYQLTIEPNTYFYKFTPVLPPDDRIWEMQQHGQALLKQHGYEQYEISAYAKKGYQCQHNINYWQFGDYLGIGAGAHGKITSNDGCIYRYFQYKNPKDYLDPSKPYTASKKIVSPKELPLEFMMNTLRLQQATPIKHFKQKTGLDISTISETLNRAVNKKFITLDEYITVTPLGRRFLNDLLELFLAPACFKKIT